jgi:dUTP pyrophosphatase
LVNLDPEQDYEIQKGDRIAQLVVIALTPSEFSLVEELPPASRGDGGFGSTGR